MKKVSLISYHQAKRQIKTKGYGLGPFDGKGQGQVPQGMLKGRRWSGRTIIIANSIKCMG
jgi:hypothetical protein